MGDAVGSVYLPEVTVAGVGRLSWPLCQSQLKQLKKVMRPADPNNIKGPLMLPAKRFELGKCLKTVCDDAYIAACTSLGLGIRSLERIEALGLFLEERGSQQGKAWQRQAARNPRTLASLVVQLPSEYEGGAFHVRYQGSVHQYSFGGSQSAQGPFFTAFYSECDTRLAKIRSGARLTIHFNINLKEVEGSPRPLDPKPMEGLRKVRSLLREANRSQRFLIRMESDCSLLARGNLDDDDRAILDLFRNTKNKAGEDLFVVALGRVHGTYGENLFGVIEDSLPHCYWPVLSKHVCWNEIRFDCQETDILTGGEGIRLNPLSAEGTFFVLAWPSEMHIEEIMRFSKPEAAKMTLQHLLKENPEKAEEILAGIIAREEYCSISLAKCAIELRRKDLFLRIAGSEREYSSVKFYKLLSRAVENNLCAWNELLPFLAKRMGRFNSEQVSFLSTLKPELRTSLLSSIAVDDNSRGCWLEALHKFRIPFTDFLTEPVWGKLTAQGKLGTFTFASSFGRYQFKEESSKIASSLVGDPGTLLQSQSCQSLHNLVSNVLQLDNPVLSGELLDLLIIHKMQPPNKSGKESPKLIELWDLLLKDEPTYRFKEALSSYPRFGKISSLKVAEHILTLFKAHYSAPANLQDVLQRIIQFAEDWFSSRTALDAFQRLIRPIIELGDDVTQKCLVEELLYGSTSKSNHVHTLWDHIVPITSGRFVAESFSKSILAQFKIGRETPPYATSAFYNISNEALSSITRICLSKASTEWLPVIWDGFKRLPPSFLVPLLTIFIKVTYVLVTPLSEIADALLRSPVPSEEIPSIVDILTLNRGISQQIAAALLSSEKPFKQRLLNDLMEDAIMVERCLADYTVRSFMGPLVVWLINDLRRLPFGTYRCAETLDGSDFESYQEVNEFLEDEDATKGTFGRGDFASIASARRVAKILNRSLPPPYFEIEPIGIGRDSYITIKKTRMRIDRERGTIRVKELESLLEIVFGLRLRPVSSSPAAKRAK